VLFLEDHRLLAVLGVEEVELVVLNLVGVGVLQGIDNFLLGWLMRGGVSKVGLQMVAPLDSAVGSDGEIADVSVTVGEGD